jgi:apolipoprotein D and lipocalin family protein
MDESKNLKWAARWGAAIVLSLAAGVGPAAVTLAQEAKPALQPVPSVDLNRYMGTWHQVALIPNKFQKQCVANTKASYELLETGQVKVTNTCRKADGQTESAEGRARLAKDAQLTGQPPAPKLLSPPKLQVRFAPAWLSWLDAVWGNYWVIQLADDYRYAVVGEPGREFLWVLAREPKLQPADRSTIESRLKEQGYDPARLVW